MSATRVDLWSNRDKLAFDNILFEEEESAWRLGWEIGAAIMDKGSLSYLIAHVWIGTEVEARVIYTDDGSSWTPVSEKLRRYRVIRAFDIDCGSPCAARDTHMIFKHKGKELKVSLAHHPGNGELLKVNTLLGPRRSLPDKP